MFEEISDLELIKEYEKSNETCKKLSWNTFVRYNIRDVELVDKLEDKLKLLELIILMAYDAKVNYSTIFSPVATWDTIIYNHLYHKGIVVPKQVHHSKNEQFEGGYVKDSMSGMFKWVVSIDATALYPSVIQSCNISPETLIGVDENITVDGLLERLYGDNHFDRAFAYCGNGAMFSKFEKGFIPEVIDVYQVKRKEAKNLMLKKQAELEAGIGDLELLVKEIASLNNKQQAVKILMNSLFGALTNKYFRYFNLELGRAITLTGQYITQTNFIEINKYLNKIIGSDDVDYIIAGDTDSVYMNLGPFVDKFIPNLSDEETCKLLDKFCQDKLAKKLDEINNSLQDYINVYRRNISFKREAIANRGLWTGAKKRYILSVMNNEGVQYAEPKLKIVGLEMIKSNTPEVARKKLKEAVKIILYQTEEKLHTYVSDFKKEWDKIPAEKIAFPSSVNGIEKWSCSTNLYKVSTPIHVRGTIIYNKYIKSMKLEKNYPIIREGEKIKYIYIKTPNEFHENVIAFLGKLPSEFPVSKRVDYRLMFEKLFIKQLDAILLPIGWTAEPKASLEDIFG